MSLEPEIVETKPAEQANALLVHVLLRFLLAVRYRKNVVLAAMGISALLGALYYVTATRYYGAKAAMLVMQAGIKNMATSVAGEVSAQRSMMKTFEEVIRSPKVIEGALNNLRPEDRIDLTGTPRQQWCTTLREHVRSKAIPSTNILEVSYSSKDPHVAVNVVNAIVQSYLDFLDKTHKGTAAEINRVLAEGRTDLLEKLDRKQAELLEAKHLYGDLGFREHGKVLDPVLKRVDYFGDQLNVVQGNRIALEASLASIEKAVRNGDDLQQHLIATASVVGAEFLMKSVGLGSRDATTQAQLEQSLLEDSAELSAMRGYLGSGHPEVIAKLEKIHLAEQFLRGYQHRVNRQITQLQNTELGPRLLEMVWQKLCETRQKEASLERQYEASRSRALEVNGHLARIQILERDVSRLQDLNDVLLDQIASIDLKQDGQEVRAAVIDQPVVVDTPISPRLSYVALLVLVGGLGVGLTGVYLLDILDDRFRSSEDLQSQLGVSVLAMVQELPGSDADGLAGLQMYAAPTDAKSEGFRTLRTALELADAESGRIVISSSEPGDGKTTILANLAVCYAQSDKKTLLVDADLRRPGLTAMVDMRKMAGLSGILRSDDELVRTAAAHIQPSGIEGLDILPSGPRPTNPAELLSNPRFSQLLGWAETVYDQILIDSPPALAASDTAIIGRLVDGVVLVVQPDKNGRRVVIRAAENLAMLKIPLLGVVINRVGSHQGRGYYGYGYGYGYGYTRGYGYGEEDPDTMDGQYSDDDLSAEVGTDQDSLGETTPPTRIVRRQVA